MSTDNEAGDVHVEVYVRSLPTHGSASRATLGRLAELEQRGLVDAHELVVWGERAPASPECAETATGADIADLVATFREWARRNDLTLAPAMRPRTVDSRLTGVHYEEVRLPELLVATYHGRDLVGVAPHERNGEVCSVRLYLDRLPDPTERAEFVPVDGVRTETETRRTVGVVDASNEGDSDRRSRPEGDTTGGADTDSDDGFGKPPTL
jgi:hypothetical protein